MIRHIKKLRIFLDLNETLIRTGEISDILLKEEINDLINFRKLCDKIADSYEAFEIIFLTGNSFEYSRRIEEPLGIKNNKKISFIIISENGLLSRSFSKGNLWMLATTKEYNKSISNFKKRLSSSKISYYTQGNEIRYTLKPSFNEFSKRDLLEVVNIANNCGLNTHAQIYTHKFYIDIDPISYIEQDIIYKFKGKYEAVNRILQSDNSFYNIAIGDSLSDIPMFEAIIENNGKAFWVSNTSFNENFPKAIVLNSPFTKGVNELLGYYAKL